MRRPERRQKVTKGEVGKPHRIYLTRLTIVSFI